VSVGGGRTGSVGAPRQGPGERVLVATQSAVVVVDASQGSTHWASGMEGQLPTCLAADPRMPGRAWCGTQRGGVFRSDDGGGSWEGVGLAAERITAIAASPAEPGLVWVGTEPSAVWRALVGGRWERLSGLDALPSSREWSFPPRPDTHHVRWIGCHPTDPGRLWIAVEAGALITTVDGGRTWRDRAPSGPRDTHELAVDPAAPDRLRSAAGDGYFESEDGGVTWTSPEDGLEARYLRSVALDPGDAGTVLVSASSRPRTAYVAGNSDGRLYRKQGSGPWHRVRDGWPDPPSTIAPLLQPSFVPGQLWAADERGVHRSPDGGVHWVRVAPLDPPPVNLRGLAVLRSPA
jgi:photosystem II stability/assembly factor-like uncharacterized protein